MEIKNSLKYSCCGVLLFGATSAFGATPTLQGQSGYVNMPSAWVEKDATFSTGYGYDRPYGSMWVTATVMPFLQITGRYVSISGIPGFSSVPGEYGSEYGRYKDKVADAKLRLWNEMAWLPAVSVGATDLLGTELFKGQYIVASKVLGPGRNIEASIGYGKKRPDGAFAGVRWAPQAVPGLALVAEYDANDYRKDFAASATAAGQRGKGPVVAAEYRWGWLGAQVAHQRDHFSANAFISVPFSEREFVPKVLEPAPFRPDGAPQRVSAGEWQSDPRHGVALVQALVRQDFRNVRAELDGATLKLVLTNNRISNMGRAVGRAARTALAFAPEGARALQITYTRLEQPIATYEFVDLSRLSDYLTGLVTRDAFLQTALVRPAHPTDRIVDAGWDAMGEIRDEGALGVQVGRDGDVVQLSSEDRLANRFKVAPKISFFFNDPSGALRYEVAAAGNFDRRLREGLYLNSAFKLNLVENISGVTQPSNSLLPHVRTDVAEYKRGGRLKLNRLLLNQYLMPEERVYGRLSAGLYEEMFRGVGGQVMYLPKDSRWAVDLAVDALQQRGYKGWFDKRDYRTVTALGSLHYRLPYDLTATARGGRYLARDHGVRIELKRRFSSGVEIGAWFTQTNGNDVTNPGTPANPYNDKGVFLSVPLNIMLPSDTQTLAGMALAPWTRDVGQMITSPGDLYELVEQPRRDQTAADGLGNFAERADEQGLDAVNPVAATTVNRWPHFRWRIEQSASTLPSPPQWMKGTMLAGGAVLVSALAEKPIDRFASRHQDSALTRGWTKFSNVLPVALAGAAGGTVLFGDSRMQNIGLISLQSIAGAALLSDATKRIVGRARPKEGFGAWSRTANRSDASFPSNHASVGFAAVTPFAQEFDAPWLYVLAASGSAGRVAGRQHWVSDTVGGAVLGYAIGSWLWQAQRDDPTRRIAIMSERKTLSVSWQGTY